MSDYLSKRVRVSTFGSPSPHGGWILKSSSQHTTRQKTSPCTGTLRTSLGSIPDATSARSSSASGSTTASALVSLGALSQPRSNEQVRQVELLASSPVEDG